MGQKMKPENKEKKAKKRAKEKALAEKKLTKKQRQQRQEAKIASVLGSTPREFDERMKRTKQRPRAIKDQPGVDPVTGRKLKDAQGRSPDQQGGAPAKVMTPKQIRARARRRGHATREELEIIAKPLDQWDMEELARGRVRDKNGGFAGARPSWITADVLEEANRRFQELVKSEMGLLTPKALAVLGSMLDNEMVDGRGRPLVAPSVKVDIAKFLMEHAVGKPKQQVETDISIRLQSVLAHVMVNPTPGQVEGSAGYGVEVPSLPGYVRAALSAPVIEADTVDEDDIPSGKSDG